MSEKRPYLSWTIDRLQSRYSNATWNGAELRKIRGELKNRSTPSARKLLAEVERTLAAGNFPELTFALKPESETFEAAERAPQSQPVTRETKRPDPQKVESRTMPPATNIAATTPRPKADLQPDMKHFLADTIQALRERLIDVSKRNRLISYKHSERGADYIRIVDEVPDQLFERLRDGPMQFAALPNPDDVEPADQKTPNFKMALERARVTDPTYLAGLEALGERDEDSQKLNELERDLIARIRAQLGLPKLERGRKLDLAALARANGFDPSFDLPLTKAGDHHDDDHIQALYLRETLDRRIRSIYDKYRGHAAETGIHTLYIVFGFAEWAEAEQSEVAHHAPLLLMPVHITHKTVRGRTEHEITGEDENLTVNMALREKLRSDFGVELPDVREDEIPSQYFETIQSIFAAVKGLSLRQFATVAVLPFPNMSIWADLDPDVWDDGALLDHDSIARMLNAKSSHFDGDGFLADHSIEDLPQQCVPTLVLEADASQHSALVDVLAEKSFALQGPPGTGKSQTITNIIATALDDGKRVLFIAEKRAALEVVGRKLDGLGFGPLMLQLHSDRSKKTEVLHNLKDRLDCRMPASSPHIENQRSTLISKRDLLKRYRALLGRPLGKSGRISQEFVWREMTLRTKIFGQVPAEVFQTQIDHCDDLTLTELASRREVLDSLEVAAKAVVQSFGSLEGSRWKLLAHAPTIPIQQEDCIRRLVAFQGAARAVDDWRNRVSHLLDAPPTETLQGLKPIAEDLANVPVPYDVSMGAILKGVLANPQQALELREAASTLDKVNEDARAKLGDDAALNLESVRDAEACLRVGNLGPVSQSGLNALIRNNDIEIAALEAAVSRLPRPTDPHLPAFTGRSATAFYRAVRLVLELDETAAAMRSSQLLSDGAKLTLLEAQAIAGRITARVGGLAKGVDFTAACALGRERIRDTAAVLRDTPWTSRPFSKGYKQAIESARRLLGRALDREAIEELMELAHLVQEHNEFVQGSPAARILATDWRALGTNFSSCISALEALHAIDTALMSAGAHWSLDEVVETPIRQLRLLEGQLAGSVGSLVWSTFANDDTPLVGKLEALRQKRDILQKSSKAFSQANVSDDLVLDQFGACSALLMSTQAARESFESAAASASSWLAETSLPAMDTLRQVTTFAEGLLASAGGKLAARAIGEANDPAHLLSTLRSLGLEGATKIAAAFATWNDFAEPFGASETFFDPTTETAALAAIEREIAGLVDDPSGLALYGNLGRYLRQAETAQVRWVFDQFESAGSAPAHFEDCFELAWTRSVLKKWFATSAGSDLNDLGGATVEAASAQFRALDRELFELEAARIVDNRLRDPIPQGVDYGLKSTFTDLGLVRHEAGKQKRLIPIRDLVGRAAGALQALKPVWLMSPSTVAQFVPPNSARFDLVVIDEASQMTPEMAIGALARGSQIVVVGDPQQLAPSDWFKNKVGEDDDDDDVATAPDVESILNLAFDRLGGRRMLKWHYRSRDPSLIQFSNRQFYDRKLVIFPSPITNDRLSGVKHEFVGGLLEGRVNQTEAERTIEALVGLIYERPELSYGVVTMNADQRELIHNMVEALKASDPVVRDYARSREGGPDELFVKNLENVQGDERDVILVSTLYGPASLGARPMQRFRAFSGKDGHRRLNVLVTRARLSTMVFTSLRPNDIVVSETTPRGVAALRDYLTYAAGGAVYDDDIGGEADSDFEVFVAERLRLAGYEVTPQVGVEGFRIDLGVKHAAYPNGFIAGVECDGATYHSGLSVRDRDHIRQTVLEDLGWNIYRVWSTDWFNDPDREMRRLLAWLEPLRDKVVARASVVTDEDVEPSASGVTAEEFEDIAQIEPPLLIAAQSDKPEGAATTGCLSPVKPSGKRHTVDGVEFIEAFQGFYEVWITDDRLGTIERTSNAITPARLFQQSGGAQKPQYVAVRDWDDMQFVADDIYAAVRRLKLEWEAR